MFEGGTRAVSFVHGARWLAKAPYVNNKLLHITDWMPTFLTLGTAKTLFAPVLYTAPCIMFWMRAYPIRGEVGGGWNLITLLHPSYSPPPPLLFSPPPILFSPPTWPPRVSPTGSPNPPTPPIQNFLEINSKL
jgi:hypothetical protein